MPLGVLEARMWSVAVVRGCGRGHATPGPYTVLEMVHFDGRVGWRARELRALSEVLLQASRAHFECKEFPGRFRGTKA